ncbi:MAG: ABC transporter permease subunit, partial [Planctomycetaceae bacterium]|nr:ABC transporter permease subunit [Planctomycetaceae bacterium]
MSLRRDAIGLPLLAKELIEQAARKRTYVIRSVYALLLFSFSLLIFWGTVYSRSNSAFGILGQGRQMFFGLFMIQIIGILLFTPALTCAAVTTEKERNTFGLLLLTKLGPMTILLEKYLARVIGISSFLILSLPLFAYCYALGGIDQYSVWIAFLSLFVLMLELAALGLFCSCLFRTTVRAFIASYILGFFLLFGPLFAVEIFRIEIVWRVLWGFWFCTDVVVNVCGFAGAQVVKGVFTLVGADLDTIFRHPPDWSEFTTNFGRSNRPNEEALMLFFPVASVAESLDRTFSKPIPWRQVFAMVPPLTMTGFLLLASRLVIIRRAFVQPRHYLMLLFRKLDGFFERLNNNRWTKGKVLIDPSNRLPDNAPVAWRETSKTTLGSVQYLIRLFLAIEFPVLALCLLVVILDSGNSRRHEGLAAIYLIVALLSVLLVCVKSAMLIAGERSRETLDVLLSTPISAEELIKQKFQGVWRLIVALWIPLLTVVGSHAWVISLHNNGFFARALRDPEHSAVCNFIVQTSSIAILLPLFAWL